MSSIPRYWGPFNNLYVKNVIQFRYGVLNNINIVDDFAYFYPQRFAKYVSWYAKLVAVMDFCFKSQPDSN